MTQVLVTGGAGFIGSNFVRYALQSHPDYPDAHYHLAQLLDNAGDATAAEFHWRQFLERAPDSPWADEARQRLELE